MVAAIRELRQEFRPMFTLAAPVVVAELGWITMGMVDTLMVGRLGPEAIGGVGLGGTLFFAIGVFAMGLMLGLDTLVSQAFGAQRLDECHVWLVHGVALALGLTVPVTAGLWLLDAALPYWGLHPSVLVLTSPYLITVTWSVLPLLLYAAFRRYLQGMGVVRPVMIALVLANVMNVVANWILIFGKLGAPAMGVRGAAWATVASRLVMAGVLFGVILYRERTVSPKLSHTPIRVEGARLRRMLALGFPAAAQITLEVGVFAAATALAGRFPPAALAAHQIALHFAAFTFMIPLGVASAGAVRVGQAVGRRDPAAVRRAGWTAILFGAAFMTLAAAVFVLFPRALIGAFTADAGVLAIGASLLLVAAVFQLFDGLQGVTTGVLRGLGDTRSPMLWNLAGHWFIGLPLGYTLAFGFGLGVAGLWWGLSTGLIICGISLLAVWMGHLRAAG
jgi:MATE family multidrug resistance protein